VSDRLRVLAQLQRAGASGVHSLDLRREGFTGNPSQRMNELRDEGYVIEAKREARFDRNGTRYTLVSEPSELSRSASPPCVTQEATTPAAAQLSGPVEVPRGHDESVVGNGPSGHLSEAPRLFDDDIGAEAPKSAFTGKPVQRAA